MTDRCSNFKVHCQYVNRYVFGTTKLFLSLSGLSDLAECLKHLSSYSSGHILAVTSSIKPVIHLWPDLVTWFVRARTLVIRFLGKHPHECVCAMSTSHKRSTMWTCVELKVTFAYLLLPSVRMIVFFSNIRCRRKFFGRGIITCTFTIVPSYIMQSSHTTFSLMRKLFWLLGMINIVDKLVAYCFFSFFSFFSASFSGPQVTHEWGWSQKKIQLHVFF